MAVTDPGSIVQLGPQEVRAGLALSDEANWNQTENDWRFFLTRGTVFGIRDRNDRVIATAAFLPFPPAAWISLVLVTADWRRRGLATMLVQRCIDSIKAIDLTPWLDATPAGAAVYGPMGFVPVLSFQRLRFAGGEPVTALQPVSAEAMQNLATRDIRVTGHDREALIREFCGRPGSRISARNEALCLVRDGRNMRQIGPVYAEQQSDAATVIEDIIATERGPFLIDVNDNCRSLRDHLIERGWVTERPFQRMRYSHGSHHHTETPVAFAGPEFG
jgi:GNAT superfamily N-acetyltransferase